MLNMLPYRYPGNAKELAYFVSGKRAPAVFEE
jgi:hypothetical protein